MRQKRAAERRGKVRSFPKDMFERVLQIVELHYSNSDTELGSGNKLIMVKHISTNYVNL